MDEDDDDEGEGEVVVLERRDEEGHNHGSETESWLNLHIKRTVTAARKKESALRSIAQ